MRVAKFSLISGKLSEMELDITQEQYDAWRKGLLIQDAMPNLTAAEREFLVSGMTPDEWAEFEIHAADTRARVDVKVRGERNPP